MLEFYSVKTSCFINNSLLNIGIRVHVLKNILEEYIGKDLDVCCRRMLLMSCIMSSNNFNSCKMTAVRTYDPKEMGNIFNSLITL